MIRIIFALAFIGMLFLTNCGSESDSQTTDYQKFVGEAQGTTFFITYFDSANTDYSSEIEAILKEFDQQVSTYKPGSVINQFNNNEIDSFSINQNGYLAQCFVESSRLHVQTECYFDHGLQNLLDANRYSSYSQGIWNEEIRDSILAIPNLVIVSNGYIKKRDKRSQFNFNAIAQGYSVDVLADFFEQEGIENYMVEIGGELRVKGKNKEGKLWTVSLEAPNSTRENREIQAMIALDNKAVVTSGSYRKFKEIDGKKYSHAIDPNTGLGVTHNLLSVSVVCEKAAVADALATAFLVMGKEKSIQFLDSINEYDASLFFIEADSANNYSSSYYNGFEELIVE